MMMMMMVMVMMRVLLLGTWFCEGYISDQYRYGGVLRIMLERRVQTIQFSPRLKSDVKTLWKRDDTWSSWDSWDNLDNFVINGLTQEDSGVYTMKDKYQRVLYSRTIDVIANKQSYERSPGESLSIIFNLARGNCNIFFHPVTGTQTTRTEIVRNGFLKDEADCAGFMLIKTCGIENNNLEMSCNGRFEVRDRNGNMALVVDLDMKPTTTELSKVGIGFGIFGGIIFCSACMKCCCGGDNSEKEGAETPDAEPTTTYQDSDSQPVRPRSAQASPHHPAQRPHTPTDLQKHSRPHKPPAYSKIKSEGSGYETEGKGENEGVPNFKKMGSAPKHQFSTPTVPIHIESDNDEPRFEVKGMTFPSALSSDSPDVYNSDKLNFL